MTSINELSLDNLSQKETQLYNIAITTKGTIEEVDRQLSDNGTLKAYKEIHKNYLELYNISTDNQTQVESLKRLIFLNWYFMVEPSCFTGIGELDSEIVFNSYKILNDYLIQNKVDREFKWMLSYYSSWDYVILHFVENKLNELSDFVKSVDHSILYVPKNKLPKGSMDNRGQMGIYWISLSVETAEK